MKRKTREEIERYRRGLLAMAKVAQMYGRPADVIAGELYAVKWFLGEIPDPPFLRDLDAIEAEVATLRNGLN